MTEAERLAELDLLIAEQERDDTNIVYAENRIFLDAQFVMGDGEAEGFSNLIGVDQEGEIISFIRPRRGDVLTTGKSWHGTIGGYSNYKCKCARCKAAWSAHYNAYMKKRRRNRPPVPCPCCGDEFVPFRGRKYCSDKCTARANKRRADGVPEADPIRTCECCEKTFRAKRTNQRYCSLRCQETQWKRNDRAKKAA